MSDEQRKQKRTFQPPPWEEEAFKAFEEKRAEKEREEALLRGAVAADVIVGATVAPGLDAAEEMAAMLKGALLAKADADAAEAEAAEASTGAVAKEQGHAAEPVADGEDTGVMPTPAALNEKIVAAMMLELAQTEVSDARSAKVVAWVAAGLTAAVGLTMVIAGLALAAKAQGQGSAVLGSAVLTIFGLIFGGMAVWVWMSSNRVRGR